MANLSYNATPKVVLYSYGYIPCALCGVIVEHKHGQQFDMNGRLHNYSCEGYPPGPSDVLEISAELAQTRLERDILRNTEPVSEDAEIRRRQTLRIAERQVDELERMLGRAIQEETGQVAMICESSHRWNGGDYRWCPVCATLDIARDGEGE